jgi:hypothetical protein
MGKEPSDRVLVSLDQFNQMFLDHRASCDTTVDVAVIPYYDDDGGTIVLTCPRRGATAQALFVWRKPNESG